MFIRRCLRVIPGSSPYSPPEYDDDEDEPYDPEFGINSPDATTVTGKIEVSFLTFPCRLLVRGLSISHFQLPIPP